ncbi:phosphonate C-P lyase system protein PhnL [Kushneria phosphatilytica]|nr:phosphonate C-P lyase system protein PhnL [Kushneria phosphatilytica]
MSVRGLDKRFVLHGQAGAIIEAFSAVSFDLHAGECLVLAGESGAGKSSLLKLLHGHYRFTHARNDTAGEATLHFDDGPLSLNTLPAQAWHPLRRDVIGYVSQFLRVVPRVGTLEVVMEPLLARGVDEHSAEVRARKLLTRLNLAERLWSLPPGTFSGGEQQRVNIARGFIAEHPILLLDEPTASLDAANAAVVIELISEARARGTAMLGIFHDAAVRQRVADRTLTLGREAA